MPVLNFLRRLTKPGIRGSTILVIAGLVFTATGSLALPTDATGSCTSRLIYAQDSPDTPDDTVAIWDRDGVLNHGQPQIDDRFVILNRDVTVSARPHEYIRELHYHGRGNEKHSQHTFTAFVRTADGQTIQTVSFTDPLEGHRIIEVDIPLPTTAHEVFWPQGLRLGQYGRLSATFCSTATPTPTPTPSPTPTPTPTPSPSPTPTPTPTPKKNNASCVDVNAPHTVTAGRRFKAKVAVRNQGTKAWTFDDGTPHNLGSQNPQDNVRWGLSRVGLPFTPVRPGSEVTFHFTATAPGTAGTYPFDWRMVEDGVGWFGETCRKTITVNAPSPTPTPTPSPTPTPTPSPTPVAQTTNVIQTQQIISGGSGEISAEQRAGDVEQRATVKTLIPTPTPKTKQGPTPAVAGAAKKIVSKPAVTVSAPRPVPLAAETGMDVSTALLALGGLLSGTGSYIARRKF